MGHNGNQMLNKPSLSQLFHLVILSFVKCKRPILRDF